MMTFNITYICTDRVYVCTYSILILTILCYTDTHMHIHASINVAAIFKHNNKLRDVIVGLRHLGGRTRKRIDGKERSPSRSG